MFCLDVQLRAVCLSPVSCEELCKRRYHNGGVLRNEEFITLRWHLLTERFVRYISLVRLQGRYRIPVVEGEDINRI